MIRTLNLTLSSRILYLVQPEHEQDFDQTATAIAQLEMVHTGKNVATVMSNLKRGPKKDNGIRVKPKDLKSEIEFSRESKDHIDCGFGFSPVTSQYKVVRIFSQYKSDVVRGEEWYDGRLAGIRTLGTGSWRSIGSAPFSVFKLAFPTYLKGALQWLCLDFKSSEFIVSFDMDKEHFQ
ncbi:unnamed protein product [Dovyalis caffra]|uniref:F-box associated beta-propeller type 3 domain-containing protein n=1 Tax=Dovyalis caffra TaxID=77055 RepID=A0AAV1RC90_9ROSI|nr:unnamed protein product [Dovyalis caffra]